MGKPKKRSHKFQYDRNRKKAWKKSKRQVGIECTQIKHAWDSKKSVKANMQAMGLALDSNKTLSIRHVKHLGKHKLESMSVEVARAQAQKGHVIDDMEYEASLPREQRLGLPDTEVQFCIYMMEKYGEDYKKMARDEKNYYQDTPKQIRRKIQTFKKTTEQYNAYLKSKETSMEEG